MKPHFIIFTFLSILLNTVIFSQDVEVTLSGDTSGQGFVIKNNSGDTLFTVLGNGSVGIPSALTTKLLNVNVPTDADDTGRGITLKSESANDADGIGGNVLIATGDGGTAGHLTIKTEHGMYNPGNINIETGGSWGGLHGGNINITTGDTYEWVGGDITLSTGYGDKGAGDIYLIPGESGGVADSAGKVVIKGGRSLGPDGGNVEISGGFASDDNNGGDVIISGGDSDNSWGLAGGDVKLIPGTGNTSDGLVIVTGSGTYSGSWTQTSDVRMKENLCEIENAIDLISNLEGKYYNWRIEEFKEKNFDEGKQIGLIAQEVEKIIPEIVRSDSEDFKSIDYSKISVYLIEAVKEQQEIINELKKTINTQSETINILQSDLITIKDKIGC